MAAHHLRCTISVRKQLTPTFSQPKQSQDMFVIRSAVALSSSICHDESVRCCECILILPPIVEIQVLDWSRWFLNTNYVGCCDITLLTPCNWGFTRLNRFSGCWMEGVSFPCLSLSQRWGIINKKEDEAQNLLEGNKSSF